MYMWSSLTTVISDIALCCSVKIDKTNIDLICYFALLRVRIFALPQKKVQQRGVSKLYRRGLEIVYVILCRNLESVAAQRFQGFYRSKKKLGFPHFSSHGEIQKFRRVQVWLRGIH